MSQGSERRRDYTVSRPIHVIYLTTWIASILLLLVFFMLSYNASRLNDSLALQGANLKLFGINGFLLLGLLAFVIVVISLILCVYSILHTHRMVGSSYRIKLVLQALRKGDTSQKANLRDGDYFLDVADELNRLIDDVKGRAEAQKQALEEAQRAAMGEGEEAESDSDPEAAKDGEADAKPESESGSEDESKNASE